MSLHNVQDAYYRYRTGLTINLCVVAIQAGVLFFLARSVGLFEDMVHGIGDNLVLVGSTIVLYFESHGATPNKGRKRILALIGGVLLIVAGCGGGYVAYERMVGIQVPLSGYALLVTSLVAVLGGGWAFSIIHGVHKNMQDHLHASAVGHLVGDLLISVVILISSIGIIFFDLPAIDSWVTFLIISPWLIFRGVQILKYKDSPEADSHGHVGGHHH